MMVMTAKVDFKKILIILAAIAAVILSVILLTGDSPAAQTAGPAPGSNDARVKFLRDFGWEVTNSPTESGQVRIPKDTSEVFDRYNLLQKGQGYDLSTYAGKTVMRYGYKINTYPGASAPVYATVLVHNDRVIGGDVTDTAPGGRIHSLKMPAAVPSPSLTGPSESQP